MTIKNGETPTGDPNKAIPISTRTHLEKETNWLNSTDGDRFLSRLSGFWSSFGNDPYLKSDFKSYIQAIYDDNFPENRALIPLLLEDIKKNRYNSNTLRFIKVYQELFKDGLIIDDLALTYLNTLPFKLADIRTSAELFEYIENLYSSSEIKVDDNEVKSFIRACYDERFPEKRELLSTLVKYRNLHVIKINYEHILHEALKINPNDQHALETLDILNDRVPVKLKDETLLLTPEDVYNKLDSMSKNPVVDTQELHDFIHAIYRARANEKRLFLREIVRYIETHKNEEFTQNLFEIFKQISTEVLANNPNEENYLDRLLNNPEVKFHNQLGDKVFKMYLDFPDQNSKSNFLNTSLKCYEESLKIEPNNLYALNKLADVNDILKKYSEAIKYREMALEAEMKSQPNADKTLLESYKKLVDAYNKQADEYYKNYQFEAAIDNYNSALKLDPGNANAQSGIRLSGVWKKTTSFYKTTLGLFESVGLKKPSAPASEDKNIQEADQSKTQHHQQKK